MASTDVLTEFKALLAGMNSDQLADLDDILAEELKQKWLPSPGPQTTAYISHADLLLYGGAGGGGKTDLIVGLCANDVHERCVVFRRSFGELDDIAERFIDVQGHRFGWNGSDMRYKRGGKLVEFGALEKPGSEKAWRGRAHDLICVERGTPVLMADGSYRPVEALRVGDMLQTLEGPRRLERTFPPQWKEAVQISACGVSQVQSRAHAVLGPSGWVCHGTPTSPRPSWTCEPSGYSGDERRSRASCTSRSPPERSPPWIARGLRHIGESLRSAWASACRIEAGSFADMAVAGAASDFAWSGSRSRATSRLALCSRTSARPQPWPPLSWLAALPHGRWNGASGALRTSSPQGSTDRCWSGIRPGGERTRAPSGHGSAQAGVPLYLHRSSGAERPSPNGSEGDDLGQTRRRSRRTRRYPHPYRTETRSVAPGHGLHEASARVSPVGVRELFDLQVEEVNHYITAGGFINKNCFDEGGELSREKVSFVIGWNRSTRVGQRCRVVIASNPPSGSDGMWLIEWFAPWVDPLFPNPAIAGELRWAYYDPKQDKTIWVEGPGETEIEGEEHPVIHTSRTFVPALLDDNPYLRDTGYRATLQGLPEPLRSQLLKGDFMAGREDHEWQVIPSEWVRLAQERWTAAAPKRREMVALAGDVAIGGRDWTVLAPLYTGCWFGHLIKKPGAECRESSDIADMMLRERKDMADLSVDGTGGWGSGVKSHLKKDHDIDCASIVFSAGSESRTNDGKLGFYNLRAHMYWRFREALDPDLGDDVMLPPDPRLAAQLCAHRYKVKKDEILIEDKDEVKKRVGSSPDEADAAVMAWHRRRASLKRPSAPKKKRAQGSTTAWMGR